MKTSSSGKGITRRSVVAGSLLATAGVITLASTRRSFSQSGPLTISLWTNDQAQQREWYQYRVGLFMEENPNIKVDYQWFPFGQLGQKTSVAFATGTAPDGFVCGDWFMPLWLDKDLIAPLDTAQLGYPTLDDFKDNFSSAAVSGAVHDGKVYALPTWFYGYLNYINTKHFEEAGLDPIKDAPETWDQFAEIAQKLTVKEGSRFVRQGAKFALHANQWTMIQFNPILDQFGGAWFDEAGKCAVNSDAGVKAMEIRASLARQGSEDPADTVATGPLPQLDWIKERSSMFLTHPVPLQAIQSQNADMAAQSYYRAIQCPGVEAGKGYSTAYGFNLVINKQTSPEKQEALHELYKFIVGDPVGCWGKTAPFTVAQTKGWVDDDIVKSYPDSGEIIAAKDNGVPLPRTLVYNELADAMHRAVQNVTLNGQDIKASLDAVALEVDSATAAYKKG